MNRPTPISTAPSTATPNDPAPISSGKSPSWLAVGLISSSYFLTLLSVVAFCLVFP